MATQRVVTPLFDILEALYRNDPNDTKVLSIAHTLCLDGRSPDVRENIMRAVAAGYAELIDRSPGSCVGNASRLRMTPLGWIRLRQGNQLVDQLANRRRAGELTSQVDCPTCGGRGAITIGAATR